MRLLWTQKRPPAVLTRDNLKKPKRMLTQGMGESSTEREGKGEETHHYQHRHLAHLPRYTQVQLLLEKAANVLVGRCAFGRVHHRRLQPRRFVFEVPKRNKSGGGGARSGAGEEGKARQQQKGVPASQCAASENT